MSGSKLGAVLASLALGAAALLPSTAAAQDTSAVCAQTLGRPLLMHQALELKTTGDVTTVDGGGYDISWQTWYEPRRIYLGARYVF